MEANPQTMRELAGQLGNTLSPDQKMVTSATEWLKSHEKMAGFAVVLLRVISENSLELHIRQAGSVYFKNFVMREWVPDTDEEVICLSDKNTVKVHIVQLMLTAPKLVQKQLSQALAIVSRADFPAKWEGLLPELVSKMACGDWDIINGVMETVNSIFHRYRYEAKSQGLWEEIAYVLGIYQGPLTTIFQQCVKAIGENQADPAMLKKLLKCLELICDVFYSLNYQDIPAFFEDNMKEWFGWFQKFLQYSNPALDPTDPESPGPVELVQAAICESVTLYTNKYDEQFKDFVPVFVNECWTLLTRLNESSRYDSLATTAIKFLTSVVKKDWHKDLFSNEAALKTICEKVVIPQLKLRDADVELFQTDGLEYIRRDIEGSDIDTRRRTTVDFVQGLCHHFEAQVTGILKNYVGVLIQEYNNNKSTNWKSKDAAMFVVLALAIKGQTRQAGATSTNPYVDLMAFLKSEVLPELSAPDVNDLPILKADCLKFISTFRFQLPADAYPVLLPLLVRHLDSHEFVIHTYAAAAVERLLSMKDKGVLRCGKAQLAPVLQGLLTGLFKVLEMDESKENSYVMKCIMRVCAVAEESIGGFANIIINKICVTLGRVAQNPRSPQFNHYLFETLACLIMHLCKGNPASVGAFEQALFPPFQTMLGMETCQEFGPYVFQILAQLLEIRSDVSEAYQGIFPSLLHPKLWDNHGNVPAIIRLLNAYLVKGAQAVVTGDRLVGLLGIFQKLNASKKLDHHGFALLRALLENTPLETLGPYLGEMLKLIFSRLQPQRRTTKYTTNLVVFLSQFVGQHGLAPLLQAMDKIQPGIFCMILEKVWSAGAENVTDDIDKKVCLVGIARMLFQSPEMLQAPYVNFWPKVLEGAIKLIEGDEATEAGGEEDLLDQSEKGFNTAMARLAFAPAPEHDPMAKIKSGQELFVSSVTQMAAANNAQFMSMVNQVPEKQKTCLQKYMSANQTQVG